jgi:hypothetical protein
MLSTALHAQIRPAVDGEMATCKIMANDKIFTVNPNQLGYFDKVSGLKPGALIPVEVYYPKGIKGQKVVISVVDGGSLDEGKGLRVDRLDDQKKLSFHFKVYGIGIHQIRLQKGNDIKVVQLWGRRGKCCRRR